MLVVANNETIWMEGTLDALLATLSARPAGALLTTPTLRLYDQPYLPDPATDTPASVHEASFQGYAAVTPTFGSVVNAANGGRELRTVGNYTLGSPAGGGATIYGAYLTDAVPVTLYCVLPLVTPAVLALAGDDLSFNAILAMLFSQTGGDAS